MPHLTASLEHAVGPTCDVCEFNQIERARLIEPSENEEPIDLCFRHAAEARKSPDVGRRTRARRILNL